MDKCNDNNHKIDKLMKREQELRNCNFVKTVLMILVVLYHSMVFWTGEWFRGEPVYNTEILSIISRWLNSFHIYGFTLVSGYIFYYLKVERGAYGKFIPYITNKSKRLLVPYVFTSVIWVIPSSVYFFAYDIKTIIKKYILAIAPSQLWFLVMLFDVFIIFWVLTKFFVKYDLLGFEVALMLYVGGMCGAYILPNIFSIWTACRYVLFFLIGFKLRQHGTEIIKGISLYIWIVADVVTFIITQYLDTADGVVLKFVSKLSELVLYIIGAVMIFVVLLKIAECIEWQDNKWFMYLKKYAMPIYLFHQQVIYFLIEWLNGKVSAILNVMLNFVGALIISIFISCLVMRFKVTRFLVGEKILKE